jgi:hypothetical protein
MFDSWKAYHPMVWTLLIGTMFARMASFMSVPFLSVYLSQRTGLDTFVPPANTSPGSLESSTICGSHLSPWIRK